MNQSNNADPVFNSETTLSEWLLYWLANYVEPVAKPSGYLHYADNCNKHIIPVIGDIQLGNITPVVLQRFFNEKARSGNLRTGAPLSSRVLKKMGLSHIKFHALRHTFATRTIESGVDVATVSGLLGHADVTTTTHFYVHPRDEAMRRAMRSIAPLSAAAGNK